jgi:hypothetical protein
MTNYTFSYIRGVANPYVSADIIYSLPVSSSKYFKVSSLTNLDQKFGGILPQNWVAYQFNGATGDTIFAVRKGEVVEIIDQYDSGSAEGEFVYKKDANSILVQHADGTYARYLVLEKGSVMVKKGDIVFPHSPLALFGTYDSKDNAQLRLMVFYLDVKDFTSRSNSIDAKRSVFYDFINPVFEIGESNNVLFSGQKYRGSCSSKLFMQELSNREKKRFGFK